MTRAGIRLGAAALLLAGAGGLYLALREPAPAPRATPPPHLLAVLERGVLRVVTINSPLTYFDVQDRESGFEYDLARAFAARLGVGLDMITVDHFPELFEALAAGTADLAAANITVTPDRADRIAFGPSYQAVRQQVVYRAGRRRPRSVRDLAGRSLEVIAGSSYEDTLERLAQEVPGLAWTATGRGGIERLFDRIAAGELDLTLVDSNTMAVHQRFYPELRVAFALPEEQQIAWAFPRDDDPSLVSAARVFFAALERDGRLARIRDRHHAHLRSYERVNTHYFRRHVESRLPRLMPHFEAAAERTGQDWKLLAAMAYQESHWDPDAVSPTGVRGIMMLTRRTAAELGVEDRRDPRESILAGARYLDRMRAKVPRRIEEPDRTWLALAAYNVGWGHLEDARVLTQRRGGDPDRWRDVARHLPLLSDPDVYPQTRFGYARGREPVRYVSNVRSYYDILTWAVERGDIARVTSP